MNEIEALEIMANIVKKCANIWQKC